MGCAMVVALGRATVEGCTLFGQNSGRPLRRCHPRDLLLQIHNYCAYHDLPMEMRPEYFDVVVENYFTVVSSGETCAGNSPSSGGAARMKLGRRCPRTSP